MSEGNKEKDSDSASDNLIDFTVVKLKRMANEFNELGQYHLEDEVYTALESYMSGNIGIVWQKGLPHAVERPEKTSETS
jgi:hypothetical protein